MKSKLQIEHTKIGNYMIYIVMSINFRSSNEHSENQRYQYIGAQYIQIKVP